MASVNKVILLGNLGADPEVKSFQNGGRMASFRMATSESWKDRQTGERKERTEWHNVVINGDGLTDVVDRYLRKGSKVYVEGSLRTRKWQDRDGADRYTTEVVLAGPHAQLVMLDGAPEGGGNSRSRDDRGGGWGDGRGSGRDDRSQGGANRHRNQDGFGGSRPPFDDDLDDDVPF